MYIMDVKKQLKKEEIIYNMKYIDVIPDGSCGSEGY